LQTDASFRFERGADPNITVYALKRAAMLIKEIAGGEISSEIKDVYPKTINNRTVDINYKNVDRLIGKSIERGIIKEILVDLEIKILEESADGLKLEVPTCKVDVTREVDIIEEILRIYGYNNIELDNKIHSSISLRQKPDMEKIQNMVSDYLSGQGFSEIMNNSLTKSTYANENPDFDGELSVAMLNPLSKDLDVLRQSLLFGGLESISYNRNRRISDQKLYEFGNIYRKKSEGGYFEEKHLMMLSTGNINAENWSSKPQKADFYFLKSMLEAIITRLGINRKQLKVTEGDLKSFAYSLAFTLNGELIAEVGNLSPAVLKAFDIKKEVFAARLNWTVATRFLPKQEVSYEPVSKFPSVRRDLALVIDKSVTFGQLRETAQKAERKLLTEVGIFDIYEGDKIPEGKKQYALSFVLQDKNKTLNDKTIDKAMKRIQQVLEREMGAVLR
jgi:phenylalanyl-tRNA synthetase beta chain